jgi:NADH-quinone oxidoreductase subunit D
MLEVVESIRICEQAVEKYDALEAEHQKVRAEFAARKPTLSADDAKKEDAELANLMKTKYAHRVEPPRALAPGECYVETECPRGQMGFFVVGRPSKENVPLRVRARSSCFANLSVTNELCKGCLLADVPAIVGSLDVVMGEIDR